MQVNNNISALRASTNLTRAERGLSKSTERLSSGYKINHAYDDAAGFSISKRMRTQIRALERSSQNAADGISVIQSAEGALNEVSAMLIRMKELSVQAASDTNSGEDRDAMQKEIEQLSAEINRISEENDFNTQTLLNGDVGRKTITDNRGVSVVRTTDNVPSGDYRLKVKGDPRQAVLTGNQGDSSYFDSDGKITVSGKITINGEVINIKKGDTMETVYNKLRVGAERAGVKLAALGGGPDDDGDPSLAGYTADEFSEGCQLLFVTKEYGKKAEIDIKCEGDELADALGISTTGVKTNGTDAKVELGEGFDKTATVSVNGDKAVIKDKNGFETEVKIARNTSGSTFTDASMDGSSTASATDGDEIDVKLSVLDAGYMTLQVGANTGDNIGVSIDKINTETLGIDKINVRTHKEAEKAIELVDIAISRVSEERAKLGAFQNRLEHTIRSVDETTENMTAAFSRIVDTDMAKEMTEYTQKQVLEKAGVSVLSQANERPQNVLALLQG